MFFCARTPTFDSDIPVRANWIAEEDNTEDAPGRPTDDQEEEEVAAIPWVWKVREDPQVLERECYFHEINAQLVEDGLCEDELMVCKNWTIGPQA